MTTEDEEARRRAYEEGAAAYGNAVDEAFNPYYNEERDDLYNAWDDGWNHAMRNFWLRERG